MHYPRAREWWERLAWWRPHVCAGCGTRWECDEIKKERLRKRSDAVRNDRTGAWTAVQGWPTRAYEQVGRAGNLTPAQFRRAQGRAR